MATTLNVFYLGTVADLDLVEGDNTSDSTSAVVRYTFGGWPYRVGDVELIG